MADDTGELWHQRGRRIGRSEAMLGFLAHLLSLGTPVEEH